MSVRPAVHSAVRLGAASVALRPRMLLINLVLLAVVAVLVCVNIGRGDFPLSITQVVESLFGGGTKAQNFIVIDVRLPRACNGLIVGAALGIAGAITQSVLRNALASPDLLGITSGASVGAVALIVLGGSGTTVGLFATVGVPLAALAGGLATALSIYLLAWRSSVEGLRLVLIGIGANAMLLAVVSWLLVYASFEDVPKAALWLNGSLGDGDWPALRTTTLGFLVCGAIALIATPTLAAMRLGDDKARSLGVRLQAGQAILLLSAVGLASLATAAAGPIGFVALAAPQIARRLLRTPGEPIVGSALVGAIVVVGGDVIARTLLPVSLPVGIVTSALGGPFLLYLLVRNNRKVSV